MRDELQFYTGKISSNKLHAATRKFWTSLQILSFLRFKESLAVDTCRFVNFRVERRSIHNFRVNLNTKRITKDANRNLRPPQSPDPFDLQVTFIQCTLQIVINLQIYL